MFGIIYLLLGTLLGKEWLGRQMLCPAADGRTVPNRIWVILPVSFGSGMLVMGWSVYLISWAASALGAKEPLFFGNLIVMGILAGFFAVLYGCRYHRMRKGIPGKKQKLVSDRTLFFKETVFLGVLFLFLTWIMFYVFHVTDGILYSGFSVFGDYAPHTAMMRSFSWGNNFPTQYPHFGGEDVKYHFMFQFLAGNLEYLGLRIDIAYNLISTLSLWGFLVLLYKLAGRITGSLGAGVLTVIFFFFRSAFTFFQFVWEHVQSGDLWNTLVTNTEFIGYTLNENWGLWNFNVYLNQRHLAFGMLIVSIALWCYLDWIDTGDAHSERGMKWFLQRLVSREAWESRSFMSALQIGILLGLCAFWNGAAVIGGLLILMGFAVFSDGKLDYAVSASVAVLLSWIQTKIFMTGQNMSVSVYWGFLAEDKTFLGVLWYFFRMSGIFFIGAVILLLFLKRRERSVLCSFLFPVIFACCISLTPDINVNHKYIMISYAFTAIFWAWAVVRIWQKGKGCQAAALLLCLCLTATGIYDFIVILRKNDTGHRVGVDLSSPLTQWLGENLTSEDLLLTPEYSMNEVTLSGVMLYCGWPYYAWSAGYDTNYRAARAAEIYTLSDEEAVRRCIESEGITYVLFEEGSEFEQQRCREDVIKKIGTLKYCSEDGIIRIYEM